MRRLALLALLFLTAAAPSYATVTLITDRSLLTAVDSIAWGTLGTEFATISGGSTTGGNPFTLSGSAGFTLFTGSTYNADFLPTDTVVSNFGSAGRIRIAFASPYAGGGAQIQGPLFGFAYRATLTAFGFGGSTLGAVSSTVTTSDPSKGDGSAPFFGIRSTEAIYELEFALFDEFGEVDGMAINDVTLGNPVPEPSTWALLALGIGLVATFGRARA